MNAAKLPIRSGRLIETPEGIILSMPLADPITRAIAFLIDFVIRGLLLLGLAVLLLRLGELGKGLLLLAAFILWWGYFIFFELLLDGSSPGKAAMKIRVVSDDFTSINFSTSLIRNLLRVADLFPGLYGVGLLSVLFFDDNKRLGDIAAKTVVINTQNPVLREITLKQSALSPHVHFTRAEQKHLIEFARFCEVGSAQRAKEIAQPLAKGLGIADSDKLVMRLRRYAKWFAGEDS